MVKRCYYNSSEKLKNEVQAKIEEMQKAGLGDDNALRQQLFEAFAEQKYLLEEQEKEQAISKRLKDRVRELEQEQIVSEQVKEDLRARILEVMKENKEEKNGHVAQEPEEGAAAIPRGKWGKQIDELKQQNQDLRKRLENSNCTVTEFYSLKYTLQTLSFQTILVAFIFFIVVAFYH